MQSDDGQASFWEQSDLLQLMAGPAQPQTGAPASRRPPAGPEPGRPAGEAPEPAVNGDRGGGMAEPAAISIAREASAQTMGLPQDPHFSQVRAETTSQPVNVLATAAATVALADDPGCADRSPGTDDDASCTAEAARTLVDPDAPAAAEQGGLVASPSQLAASCLGKTLQPEAALVDSEAISTAPLGLPDHETATGTPADGLRLSTSGMPGDAHSTQAATAQASALPACPQRLLILDTETTGLSPEQGQCIEVGAVLFDVASRAVLMQVSFLLPCEHNPAQHVNGIPAAVSRLSQPWQHGLACFEAMVANADAVLAHNVGFDRQWFGLGDLPTLAKPWICSMEDIRWPPERHLRSNPSVRDLALAYGVPVWAAHRALTDCIYLVQVFQRCDDLELLLREALEPRRLVRARLSYDERQLAKTAGFRWNEPVPKAWSRRLSEREIAALPFAVDPVEAEEPARQRREGSQPLWRRSA